MKQFIEKYSVKYTLCTIIIVFIFCSCTAQQPTEYELIELPSDTSCFGYEITKNGELLNLNQEAKTALECPNVIGVHDQWLFYTNDQHQIKQYNLDNHTSTSILTLYSDIDGVDGPFWSPDYSKVAFTIVNQNMNHGYQHIVRVIVFDVDENGQLSNKQKFDIDAYFECGSRCGSTIEFSDNNTIKYRDIQDKAGAFDVKNYKYLRLND